MMWLKCSKERCKKAAILDGQVMNAARNLQEMIDFQRESRAAEDGEISGEDVRNGLSLMKINKSNHDVEGS